MHLFLNDVIIIFLFLHYKIVLSLTTGLDFFMYEAKMYEVKK